MKLIRSSDDFSDKDQQEFETVLTVSAWSAQEAMKQIVDLATNNRQVVHVTVQKINYLRVAPGGASDSQST